MRDGQDFYRMIFLTGAPTSKSQVFESPKKLCFFFRIGTKKTEFFWGLKKLLILRGDPELKKNRVSRVPHKTFFPQWSPPQNHKCPPAPYYPAAKVLHITCHFSVGLGRGKQEALLENV